MRAELQLDDENGDDDHELEEVQGILREASGAMETWLGYFIDPQEVKIALIGAQQAEDAWDVQRKQQ